MPDLLEPDPLVSPKGVQFVAPPLDAVPGILASIERATALVPANGHGMLVGLADQHGLNAAVVRKVDGGVSVVAWLGKAWKSPGAEYGVSLLKVW